MPVRNRAGILLCYARHTLRVVQTGICSVPKPSVTEAQDTRNAYFLDTLKMLKSIRATATKFFAIISGKSETYRACDISRADAQRVKNINAYC